MAQGTNFGVEMTLDVVQKIDKYDATIKFIGTDAGEKFVDFSVLYYQCPAETMDGLEALLVKYLGRPLPVKLAGLKEKQFDLLERKLIKLMWKLNDMALRTAGWTSIRKRALAKKWLKQAQMKRAEFYLK